MVDEILHKYIWIFGYLIHHSIMTSIIDQCGQFYYDQDCGPSLGWDTPLVALNGTPKFHK